MSYEQNWNVPQNQRHTRNQFGGHLTGQEAYEGGEQGSATTAAFATLLLLAVLFFLALASVRPPSALPASAPADQFSAMRALGKLQVIARQPHPTGSAEHARVREYLLGELRGLGLDPQVQTASVARTDPKWYGRAVGATVNNVLARLPGSANTRAVMLVAHYDSVPSGPGASDDGSGVVTELETLRALRAGPPLRNDVIFLITDAEEAGLLGAQAFVNEHPWAHEPGVVLNFEARGACGPASMFETSVGNGWLVHQFAEASPYPVTSSFSYEAYKRLPNDTDLTVFKRAGLAGLNFAYAGCWARYHTEGDSVQNLDPRSLQHQGSYALALARRFGDLDLTETRAADAVYFNVWRSVIHYPVSWTLPILALAILLAIFVVVRGFRRGVLGAGGVAAGFFGWLLAAALATAACEVIWRPLRPTHFVSLLPYGMAYNGDYYAWAFVALTVAIVAAVYAALFKWFDVQSLTVGALAWWLLLGVVLGLKAPAASYLVLLPLLASLAELAYAFTRRHPERETDSVLLWTLPAVVGVLLVGALPYLVITLVGTLLVTAVVATVALLAGFLVPHLHILTRAHRWWVAGVSAVASAVLITAGMASAGYSPSRQRADSVFYLLDADSGQAAWMSADSKPDAWTAQFLTPPAQKGTYQELGFGKDALIKSAAPRLDLTTPDLATLEDQTLGDRRRLDLQFHFAPGTQLIWVNVKKARVLGAAVEGKPVTGFNPTESGSHASGSQPKDSEPGWLLAYAAPPPEGLRLQLDLEAGASPLIRLFQDSSGLPAIPGTSLAVRPADVMPTEWWPPLDSSTVVERTFEHFEVSSGTGLPASR